MLLAIACCWPWHVDNKNTILGMLLATKSWNDVYVLFLLYASALVIKMNIAKTQLASYFVMQQQRVLLNAGILGETKQAITVKKACKP